MSNAFLFPGQGSQEPGMGRDLADYPAARRVFKEADEALGRPLSRLMFEGPAEEVNKTSNAQPAILACSLACLEVLRQETGLEPEMAAGHSLGEYTALVAAGALSREQAFPLVEERGRLMQSASEQKPGGMAAIIGLGLADMADVCFQAGVEMANVNSPQQIVVAGGHMELAQALDLAAARGAKKCVLLQVGGGFHSSLMSSAREGLAQALEQVSIASPRFPVFANMTGQKLDSLEKIRQELAGQLCGCVRWDVTMEAMAGASRFFEIGPGRVLSGLVPRNNLRARAESLGTLEAIRAFAAA